MKRISGASLQERVMREKDIETQATLLCQEHAGCIWTIWGDATDTCPNADGATEWGRHCKFPKSHFLFLRILTSKSQYAFRILISHVKTGLISNFRLCLAGKQRDTF